MRALKLFWLMTQKNLLVMRRSWVWTGLELVLPLIIGIPVSILIFQDDDYSTDKTPIYSQVVSPSLEFGSNFGYSMAAGVDESELNDLIALLCPDKSAQQFLCDWTFFNTSKEMLDEMQSSESYFMSTLVFNEINIAKKILSYDIYLYDWTLRDGISATWSNNDPYAWLARLNPSLWYTWDPSRIQFQYALNAAFMNLTNSSPLPPITVDGLSWLDLQYRGWMDIFSIYHTIIAAIILPIMIHTGREIGSEKENGVKDFLSVMGLSPFIFISSHVFIGWIKGIIVVTAACIVPAMRLTNGLVSINVFFFFLPIYLYVLAAVVMSATVASVFNTSNSTIRVITIVHPLLVFLSVLDQTTPSIYNPWLSTVASLSYNGCLSRVFNAIQSYLYRNRALSFAEFFEQTKYIFNIGPAICMLLFDIFWMSLIIIGAEFYYKSTDFSLFTFFKRIFSRGNKIHQGNIDEVKKLENSHEEIDKNLEADIVVENMTKIWGSTGDFAVQDMNLRARRGEVTVLLGHNGAGKSTTFSVICGITPQTSGIVKVNAQRVGYCPQGNALFERLTAMEHLWFFHQVKGAKNDWKIEGAQLLETLQMGEKKNTNSMALSGGMKRKLCLAMALIGDSKVVMLDEPTAGMDTGARQDVQRMLDIEKKNRTILFTTHYMDEAESLGDRIIIMVRGRDVASGSSQFLKRRFGTGYVLTIVMEDKSLRESSGLDILKEVKLFVSTATLTRFHGKQIEITLPQESQAAFSKLFAHLEDSQNLFGVSSFGLSINNLEQVFIRVGEMAEHGEDGRDARKEMFDSKLDERTTSSFNLHLQLMVLLWKRILYSLRNWPQWIYQLALPLIITFLLASLIDWENIGNVTGGVTGKMHKAEFSEMGTMRMFIAGNPENSPYSSIIDEAAKAKNIKIERTSSRDYLEEMLSQPLDLPPLGCGISFFNETPSFIFNPLAYWPYPTLFNALPNALLKSDGGSITTSYGAVKQAYKSTKQDRNAYSQIEDIMIGLLTVLVFAMLTSPLAIFHVVERVTKFLHQQSLTAVSGWMLYSASILYDTITFLVMTALITVAFHIGGWAQGQMLRVLIVFILYFVASLPSVYLLASFFTSAPRANSLITIYQTMGAYGSLLIISIVQSFTNWDPKILAYFFQILLPSFGLYRGIQYSRELGRQTDPSYEGDSSAHSEYVITLILLASSGFILSLITFLSRWAKIRYVLARRSHNKNTPMTILDDSDVVKEREIVDAHSGKFALEVNTLVKHYGHFTALNRLTFAMKEAECFGLLGVNGAGKTTTFGILTGEIFASSGSAFLGNQEITGILTMGYCPQFDAYLQELTGKEVLWILATLYGYKYPAKKAHSILRAVLMEENGKKQLKHCSGGQKRKISVGIALLARSTLIILDEPTAGIDPRARREIWSLIGVVRDIEKRAVLLCSHSMDECEALCTRVGILVRGHLRAIGTTQHLKSKFGNSYQLMLVYSNEEVNRTEIPEEVKRSFPGATLHSDGIQGNVFRFTIPRQEGDRWSSLWERGGVIALRTGAIDYSLAQNTLTQTFLTLSGQQEENL